jgi:sRNA-binding regulator protein Hfq
VNGNNATRRSLQDGVTATNRAGSASPQVQQDWLAPARGQRVSVRLLDGKILAGTLVDSDQYCLALVLPDQAVPVLLFKHGISALRRQDGGDA